MFTIYILKSNGERDTCFRDSDDNLVNELTVDLYWLNKLSARIQRTIDEHNDKGKGQMFGSTLHVVPL